MVTIECPFCGKSIEVTEYNKVTRSDALVGHIASEHFGAIRPAMPNEGPPLPRVFDISWPSFMKRGIDRLIKEPPWKTIPKYGLKEELKREFEVVTGRKLD